MASVAGWITHRYVKFVIIAFWIAVVVGEIAVRSSSLTAEAARSVNADGYFRTGDSGMLDDSGALYIL